MAQNVQRKINMIIFYHKERVFSIYKRKREELMIQISIISLNCFKSTQDFTIQIILNKS